MTRNGIGGEQQDVIVQSITSFALYGFPESHAASFALIAYASAYFKCHYLAAFTCALLNNQPMGFYSPAVIVKDAQRHGLRVLPVEVNVSEWKCTIEGSERVLRLGLRYVRGLRAVAGQAIAAAKPFRDVDDMARRVPELNKGELEMLAGIGALVKLETAHRRDALVESGACGASDRSAIGGSAGECAGSAAATDDDSRTSGGRLQRDEHDRGSASAVSQSRGIE